MLCIPMTEIQENDAVVTLAVAIVTFAYAMSFFPGIVHFEVSEVLSHWLYGYGQVA